MFHGNVKQRSFFMLVVICFSMVLSAGSVSAGSGNVLPPTAKPHGYTLGKMAVALANFNVSGNDLTYYPDTPFQILYADFSKPNGENTFTVRLGTEFFVPIFAVTDSPPVIGDYPSTAGQAAAYIFDQVQIGGHDFSITVDGQVTRIGPPYVAGPEVVDGLIDGGSHIVMLGAFLTPLNKGTHTVIVSGGYNGDVVGNPDVIYSFPYTVIVK